MTMTLKPLPLPTPKDCPVCREVSASREAIAAHNLAASQTGERVYRWR